MGGSIQGRLWAKNEQEAEAIRASGRRVVYAVCVNADPHRLLERVARVAALGGNAVHLNFWCGLGAYRAVRALDLPLFVHFQQSGSRVLTHAGHEFSLDFEVLCQLAALSGVDTMHIGNLFGYSGETEEEILRYVTALRAGGGVLPTLSCGMHPGVVNAVTAKVGPDYLANVGGAIHGHPGGTRAGARAMRQAIDGQLDAPEYRAALEAFGSA